MQAVSIIGANSFIGRHLLTALQKNNFSIRVLLHKRELDLEQSSSAISVCRGDLLKRETLESFITPNATVINLAYLAQNTQSENIDAIKNLAEVCAEKKVKRLIHCSTAMVHGSSKAAIIHEDSICKPQSEYEQTKYNLEKILLTYKTQFELAILQPTAVIGPYGKNLVKLAQDLRLHPRWVNYLKSCCVAKRRMHLVGVENVVAAIVFLAQVTDLQNKTHFLISQDEVHKNIFHNVESYLLKRLQLRPYLLPVIPLPLTILTTLANLLGKNAANPQQIYLGKNLNALGFQKPVSFEDSLIAFCNWYESQEFCYEST